MEINFSRGIEPRNKRRTEPKTLNNASRSGNYSPAPAWYLNYRYGDQSLTRVNTFLLAYFIARTINYFLVFGGFYGDLAIFCGIAGLGLSLNGGIRQPAKALQPAEVPVTDEGLEPQMPAVPVFGRTTT